MHAREALAARYDALCQRRGALGVERELTAQHLERIELELADIDGELLALRRMASQLAAPARPAPPPVRAQAQQPPAPPVVTREAAGVYHVTVPCCGLAPCTCGWCGDEPSKEGASHVATHPRPTVDAGADRAPAAA